MRGPRTAPVIVRPASPSDGEALGRMFSRLLPKTILLRFHAPYPQVPAWAGRLFVGDGAGVSLVALEGERIVGHAMYVPLEGGRSAEVGILVEDERQSRGIGRRLLARLAREAALRGVESLTAEILGDNRRALDLFSSVLPGTRYAPTGGNYHLRSPLGAPDVAA